MNQSEQINDLAAALAKAQGQITGALKDSANPFFKSKYADLASCWDACRKQLSENGLSVIQTTTVDNGHVLVETTLAHSSGQWIRGSLPVKVKDDGPQAQGSGITYARRYALAAIVGLAQIDDDAEAAQGRTDNPRKIPAMPEPAPLNEKDEAAVNSFVSSFMDLLNADITEEERADQMAALRNEASRFDHIFVEVWRRLGDRPKDRAAIKKYVELANKRRAA